MPGLDFYNLSQHRKYPFTPDASLSFNAGAYTLDWRFILDCGFTLGGLSDFKMGYRPGDPPQEPDYVRLTKIERTSATELEFTFVASSMPLYPFVFTRNVADGEGAVGYTEANSNPLYGVGFLVTGDLSLLVDPTSSHYIATDITPDADGPEIEQSLIVATPRQAVTSINVGNLPRVKAETPQPTPVVKVVASDLTDGITLEAGYNTALVPNMSTSQVEASAIVGAGKGEPCGEIERYPGEDPETGALLSGGPKCNELVYTISGVTPTDGGDFIFRASNGLRVVTDNGNHKITIIANLEDVVVCSSE
jgi:hypothetical protein